ncbi:hypothetical protein LCGC14_3095980, partial [marine sediment metagenome]
KMALSINVPGWRAWLAFRYMNRGLTRADYLKDCRELDKLAALAMAKVCPTCGKVVTGAERQRRWRRK